MEEPCARAALAKGHVQSPDGQVTVIDGAESPADHETRVQVDDDRQEQAPARNEELLVSPIQRTLGAAELPAEQVGRDGLRVVAHRRAAKAAPCAGLEPL